VDGLEGRGDIAVAGDVGSSQLLDRGHSAAPTAHCPPKVDTRCFLVARTARISFRPKRGVDVFCTNRFVASSLRQLHYVSIFVAVV